MILPVGGIVATQTGCGDDNGGPYTNGNGEIIYDNFNIGGHPIIVESRAGEIPEDKIGQIQGRLDGIAIDNPDLVAGLQSRNVKIIVEDAPAYESGESYRVVNANTIAIRSEFLLSANNAALRGALENGFIQMLLDFAKALDKAKLQIAFGPNNQWVKTL
jgi:hypothetical protein